MSNNDSTMRVAFVTDGNNRAAGQYLDAILGLKAQADPGFPKYHREPASSTIGDLSTELGQEVLLLNKLNQGDQILVAALGVPGRPDNYRQVLHNFLDTWSQSNHKPVLLLVSDKPALTQEIVDSWPKWDALREQLKLPPDMLGMLKKAVKVNDDYLVKSAIKLPEAIRERVNVASQLKELLAIQPDKPSPVVERPALAAHDPGLPFKPVGA